ncbi:galactokinase [Gordonia hankookensis]|uniref:Galactokinase n=1 Tax=Gordonia hankookensis TaxID=589403 RepID=A0ABR7WEK8_9ACTN|nr:galactokinase [Gordonia hankookensis]MBD1321217.1 galactokinase [Gordonia hankookensis]
MSNRRIRSYAPGRVNLIGEHTDYNLGFALPIALDLGTTADFAPDTGDGTIVAESGDESGVATIGPTTAPGDVTGWGAYIAGCVWALRTAGHDVAGGRLHVESTVPVGAGLSSSAALECAALLAITADLDLSRHELARLAQHAENDYVGAPTGLLDQLSSLFGQQDTALLIDFRSLEVEPVPMPVEDSAQLLVIDSHAPHRHAAGEYAARRASCEAAAAELGVASLREARDDAWKDLPEGLNRARARHILTENARVLAAASALRLADFAAVGELMNASHDSMRDDFEITTPHIDLIAVTAQQFGAHGARMTGGGFGGSVIALAPAAAAERICADLPAAIAAAGHPTPTVRRVRPGRGAHLI